MTVATTFRLFSNATRSVCPVLWACTFVVTSAAADQLAIRPVQSIALDAAPDYIALSADKSMIAVASGDSITTIHHRTETRKVWKCARAVVDLAVVANGQLLAVATGDTIVHVYESRTGKLVQQVHRRDALSFLREDAQQNVCFFPDGKKLISIGERKRAFISDVKSGDWDYIAWVKQPNSTPLVSTAGEFVALIGPPHEYEQSGQILMFKVRRGLQPLWTGRHAGERAATCAAFSPHSKWIASGGAGDGARVWHVESGEQIAHLSWNSDNPLLGVSFVGGGSQILMAAPTELQLRAIDSSRVLARHTLKKPIKAFAASRNGDRFITCTDDAELLVWDIGKK